MTARRLALPLFLAALVSLAVPEPVGAWWERLEKLSGAGPFWGPTYEFRVACFGEVTPAKEATLAAEASTRAARSATRRQGELWLTSLEDWSKAGMAWAAVLREPYVSKIPSAKELERRVEEARKLPEEQRLEAEVKVYSRVADDEEVQARSFERRGRARLMATSSVGVFWSLCSSAKNRRVGIDVSWSTLDAEGEAAYAGGAPINLDTLMASVSWRLLPDTRFDFVDVGAGGGVYWFTSTGFKSHSGIILQPVRLTFRAPPAWIGQDASKLKRLAAVPGVSLGLTMFPAGFEADDFNGVGEKAVRLPREILPTLYFFLNVEPFLQLLKK